MSMNCKTERYILGARQNCPLSFPPFGTTSFKQLLRCPKHPASVWAPTKSGTSARGEHVTFKELTNASQAVKFVKSKARSTVNDHLSFWEDLLFSGKKDVETPHARVIPETGLVYGVPSYERRAGFFLPVYWTQPRRNTPSDRPVSIGTSRPCRRC